MRLETARGGFEVEARMSGRTEPIDGRFHWDGRIAPDPRVAELVRSGVRDALLDGARIRLMEIDPWGGVLVRGVPG
jgi:hypothetical protein